MPSFIIARSMLVSLSTGLATTLNTLQSPLLQSGVIQFPRYFDAKGKKYDD